jgi:hypothetical protein
MIGLAIVGLKRSRIGMIATQSVQRQYLRSSELRGM